MRLFVAVLFTPKVKQKLVNAAAELKKISVSGDFTRKDNLHLTLAFIGETDMENAAKTAIEKVEAQPIDIRFGGLGHFGDIYWAGIEPNGKLQSLAKEVQNNLREQGFRLEKRDFRPHITLARRLVLQKRATIGRIDISMSVHRISLMKSERIDGRLTYTEIFGKELL